MGCSPSCSAVIKWNSSHSFMLHALGVLKLLFLCCTLCFGDVSLADSDKSVLLQFKNSVSDPHELLSSWKPSDPSHCSWLGVLCDSGSRVVSLNLTGNGGEGKSNAFSCHDYAQFPLYGLGIRRNCEGAKGYLTGKLPGVISKLNELRILSLPFNDFGGEIASEIWGMEKLEVLDLEGNLVAGILPLQVRGLKNLRVLNLGFNRLAGELPSSLSTFRNLEILNLAGNGFNGSVPGFVGKLRQVYLMFNLLSGEIPSDIGDDCGKLEHLDLSGNFLARGIPRSLGNCRQLRSLSLYENMLEEAIPAELGLLQKLQVLDVSRNSLSGSIPKELGNCSDLSVLVLSNLFRPIPVVNNTIRNPSQEQLDLMDDELNYYEGGIPEEITMLPKLKIIWAPRATLEGSFPRNWGACDSLEIINLSQNYFKGKFPIELNQCKKLQFLDLSCNHLTGGIHFGLPVPCMTVFDVSGNSISGSIPKFSNYSCSPVHSWNPSISATEDPSSVYKSFFVSACQLGTLSHMIGSGSGLSVFHNFGHNNLTGIIQSIPIAPERLGKQTVYAFFVGENKLTGSFPGVLFEKCDGLDGFIVNVSHNGLSGEIPVGLDSMCRSLKYLDLSRNEVNGTIPSDLGALVSLVGLNLSWNQLKGPIPASLGLIKDLKFLSLAGNNLTSVIPTTLSQLYSLEVLDLSSNSLTGEIPKVLINLRSLRTLLLNNNKLTGQIPSALANVTSLSSFNVSFNNLSGSLPLNSNLMKCNSALGNPRIQSCRMFSLTVPSSDPQGSGGELNSFSAAPPEDDNHHHRNGFNSIEIASITSASAIVSVLLALIVLFFYTRKWNSRSRVGGSTRKEVTIFNNIGVTLSYETVVRATGSFNASNCIGSGGFGATYKAEISPGILVAIKRLAVGRFQGVQQFHAEIKTLGRLRHQNLVTLIGYHASEMEMFLIYNYLPGGNLEKFIHERSKRAVDWRILHKIALDIARALAYLHDQCVPRVLHRDVKPSNILLDDEHNAYLSDFGLARLLGTSETHATTGVAGTFGYVAPEYAMTCRVSDKADVYSYGVVLLELLSDKKALDPSFSSFGNGFNIVAWGCLLLRQGRAKEFFTAGLWDAGPHDDLVEVLHLAVVCTVDSLSTRPTMKQVVRRLKQLQPPPC